MISHLKGGAGVSQGAPGGQPQVAVNDPVETGLLGDEHDQERLNIARRLNLADCHQAPRHLGHLGGRIINPHITGVYFELLVREKFQF
jgi:hypothetical protein